MSGDNGMRTDREQSECSKAVLLVMSIFLPPVAVCLAGAGLGGHFWLNILLCLLGWIPGVIHAIWYIYK